MVVVVAVGHRLAQHDILTVSGVLDEPFPGTAKLHPEWTAFWTLEAQRGGPAKLTDDEVLDTAAGLDVIAAGRAIGTAPAWVASGLAHPGVVALSLSDGPPVATRLVWRADVEDPAVLGLVDLATAWSAGHPPSGARGDRRYVTGRGDAPSRRRPR
jgi:DNA-binding transcriptional LysR family regulator